MVKILLSEEQANSVMLVRKNIGAKRLTLMTDAELIVDSLAKEIVSSRRIDGIEPDAEYLDSIHCLF